MFEYIYPEDSMKELQSEEIIDKVNLSKTFKYFTKRIRFILVQLLTESNGEKERNLKLYLHVLYEIMYVLDYIQFIEIKNDDNYQNDQIFDTEAITSIMENLEERTEGIPFTINNFQDLNLIFAVRE